ncbi:RNA polymerase, sigma-24 subunit, ECF subfamily [Actinosynnema mirum DSM 43827]|uniref:RNA polymerase, sigma-24 subunit, ECF subfamily n=1 Tax=Actinosynnema mirum (strain ATCC 29888 / DSM 43827 / JCM 3225 / NBRC 14064 / NCIMB 13271 / NRRL B-12336 / IMRU 3971 / 101) TaxID=446462 RepID=C6WP37_ACTMD|nr:RNA polymerase, sigma-24 subunit, ECF subfamily [Actinosynnema mirum DSM 43827]AXX30166.1 RNA polymerase sigma factor [Actinosynnema pretiosum subsp. pretiosum]
MTTIRVVTTPTPDDEVTRWALRARSGDRNALEQFVRGTQRDVWRFTAHLAGVDVADDLSQETYARALTSLHRFAGRSSARTWLLVIARRVVVDQVRMAQSRPRLSPGADWVREADRRPAATGFEDAVELNLLLDSLDQDRREALVLTQVLGLSYAEAADVAGCPVGTIRSRVARARDDLMRAVDVGEASEVG